MALFTTYLSAVSAFGQKYTYYYIMRNRGNDEVAPSSGLLQTYKAGLITWEEYAKKYTEQIQTDPKAVAWIDKIAEEALLDDVVLVCFEKDQNHCHRSLLALQITFRHPEVNYVGDLHPFNPFIENNPKEEKII